VIWVSRARNRPRPVISMPSTPSSRNAAWKSSGSPNTDVTLPGIYHHRAKMQPSHSASGLVIETHFSAIDVPWLSNFGQRAPRYDPDNRVLALSYLRQRHALGEVVTPFKAAYGTAFFSTSETRARSRVSAGSRAGASKRRGKIPGVAREPSTRPGPSDAADALRPGPPLQTSKALYERACGSGLGHLRPCRPVSVAAGPPQ
jgi:hypothetical protein